MLEYDRIDLSEGIDVNKCEDTSKKLIYASIIIACLKILIIKDIYVMDVMIMMDMLIVLILHL